MIKLSLDKGLLQSRLGFKTAVESQTKETSVLRTPPYQGGIFTQIITTLQKPLQLNQNQHLTQVFLHAIIMIVK
jgi:hypothetical protein